jgi:hypothetical protein
MHPFFVSRPAGYPNSIFCQILLLTGSMQQMNDWSRLAVDPTRKTPGPNRTLILNTALLAGEARTTPFVLDNYLS